MSYPHLNHIPQEVIEKDIKENNNRLDYYNTAGPGKPPHYIPIWSTWLVSEGLLNLLFIFISITETYISLKYEKMVHPTKIGFLKAYLIMIIILLVLFFIIGFISKKNNFWKKVSIVLTMISTVVSVILLYFCIKVNSRYSNFYLDELGYNPIIAYRADKMTENSIYFVWCLHFIYNMVSIIQLKKSIKRKKQRDKAMAFDDVLFDKEENIKV